MRITDIHVYVVGQKKPGGNYKHCTFLKIETDEGVHGWGEATNYGGGGSFLTAQALKFLKSSLIGENPEAIEELWQKTYRRFTYLGSRGFPTTFLSGIDIALWDIRGKVLGRPIYDLLGGALRETITLYGNGWFANCTTPEQYADSARIAVDKGFTALKLDPFSAFLENRRRGYVGSISLKGEQMGLEITSAVRSAVGSEIEILIDAHGHYDVPTAKRLADGLSESNVTWFEEPLPPENFSALKQLRESTTIPICVGERLYTRWDFVQIFENRLADYIMPDVTCTGGISELRKIAAMAEIYYIPISPHNAAGPIQIFAGAHTMMNVPNFYRLEFNISAIEGYNQIITPNIDVRNGNLHLSDKPGLGIDLDEEYLQSTQVNEWNGGWDH